jgi:AAA15 family ATPase/GTPase
MLDYFSITNFGGINGFCSTFNSSNDDYPIFKFENIGNIELIKISGGNSSGKTTVLKAIKTMRDCVKKSIEIDSIIPHVLQSREKTVFEIRFVKNGIKYEYVFVVKGESIIYEKLSNEHTETTIFLRQFDYNSQEYKWEFDKNLFKPSNLVKSWISCTRKDALFLSTAAQLNAKFLHPFIDWFLDLNFFIETPLSGRLNCDGLVERSINVCNSELLKLAQLVDKTVTSVGYNEDHNIVFLSHNSNGNAYALPLSHESRSMKRLFEIAPLLIDTMMNREVIFIDDLECYFDKTTLSKIIESLSEISNGNLKQLVYTSLE